ncbi:MAG: hypothetical protein HY301_12210 [Verrucomicrobia bacterium]|nr:hypothetical protein [Verrucomicrobiota bacterium]
MNTQPHSSPEDYLAFISRQIGAELRARREPTGLTPYGFAMRAKQVHRIQLSDQIILNIEKGTARPNLGTLVMICHCLGTTLGEFITAAERRRD